VSTLFYLMVILIGHDWLLGEYFCIGDFSNEDGVGADINLVDDFCFQVPKTVL